MVYGDLNWPSGQDPTSVPPEWHGAHMSGRALAHCTAHCHDTSYVDAVLKL